MALFFMIASFYNSSMKHTFTILTFCFVCFTQAFSVYAQGWKLPAKRAAQQAASAHSSALIKKTAQTVVNHQQIKEAASYANHIWATQLQNKAQDQKILASWALQQSLRAQSSAYQAAAKQLAFIRQNAALIQASATRSFEHVNSIKYGPLIKDKNKVLIAADWVPGSRLQVLKIVQTLRQKNPDSRIIVASPFFPKGKQSRNIEPDELAYPEQWAKPFFQTLLLEKNILLMGLESPSAGASVKNNWKAWLKTISADYTPVAFGKTQDIVVVIAPARFIEGNAHYLKNTGKAVSPWNKDQLVTLSIRTKPENNLTDFKWDIISAAGKKPLAAPYTNYWLLNAFVDQVSPKFAPLLGTDAIIRVHPKGDLVRMPPEAWEK